MEENLAFEINSTVEIDNRVLLQQYYSKIAGHECDLDKLKDDVNNKDTEVIYLNQHLVKMPDSHGALYMLIDTDELDSNGETIYISLRKQFGAFIGHIVGSVFEITRRIMQQNDFSPKMKQNAQKLCAKLSNKVIVQRVSQSEPNAEIAEEFSLSDTEDTDIFNEIRNKLLINNWATEDGLRRYILILGTRAKHYVDIGDTGCYVINSLKSIVINTGLLNKFGQPICVMYRHYANNYSYRPYKLMESKTTYINEGFTLEDASKELRPITFVGDDTPAFSTNILEYDVSFNTLVHCIEARRDRFPESVREVPDMLLAQKLMQELTVGLSIHRCGGNYAKPIYKNKSECIQWLLPLHINTSIAEQPELIMVIGRNDDNFFGVRTVLPYDDQLKDWIRATAPYADLW